MPNLTMSTKSRACRESTRGSKLWRSLDAMHYNSSNAARTNDSRKVYKCYSYIRTINVLIMSQVRRHRIPHDKDSPGQKVCRGWRQHRVGSRGEGTGCTSLRPSQVQFVQATRHAVTSCTFARAYIRTHAAGVRCVRSQIPKTSVLLGHT